MGKNDSMDLNVPARVADGWRYVITFKGGGERYFHAPHPLATIRDLHGLALQKNQPFLTFEGARWDLEDGPDCAGYVLVSEVVAIGYANPIAQMAVDMALRDLAGQEQPQEGQAGAAQESNQPDAGDAALRSLGQGWGLPTTPAPAPTPAPEQPAATPAGG